MNAEELKTEFGLEFPTEIDGYKRPAEPLESGHDWYIEIPQLIAKDKVLYTGMNLILSALLSNEKLLKQWHDTLQNVVNAQDWRVVTDTLKGYMTPELKKKLDGIAAGANNYVHPSTHPATMITQDATHRFVSDTEKNTWNAKASTAVVSTTANGLAPKRDGNASHFLAGDGTWKVVSSASSATSATKATQDSRGQQIDTTYIKGVTGSNATLTVTKGNGTTSTVTVNNVANATNANVVTEKAITGNTLASALPVGMTWSKVYNNGFPCAYGNCLSIRGAGAIQIVTEWSGGDATPANMYYRNARDSSIDKWSAWRTLAHTGGTISNATTASKLGTGTVGSGVKPIYLNAGSPAASGSTVGSANKPVYLNAGTISQCSIDLSTLAPKASPGLTGTPTAPTANVDTNNTQIATCGFVRNAIAKYAPMLDTMKKIYPVGSIYISTVSTNPSELFGFGTWEAMPAGRVLLAQGKSGWGTTYNAGETGGEATHQLTVGELPAHTHSASTNTTGEHTHTYTFKRMSGSDSSPSRYASSGDPAIYQSSSSGSHSHSVTVNSIGSNQPHNNIQPYISVYMWKRSA